MEFKPTDNFIDQLGKFTANSEPLRNKVDVVLSDFQENLVSSKYYRKPLKGYGKLDIHELSVGGDYRIIIQFFIKDDVCYYINFGTHSSLNLSGKGKTKINPKKA